MANGNSTIDISDGLVPAPQQVAAQQAPVDISDGLVPMQSAPSPSVSPTLSEKAHSLADEFVRTMPIVGDARELAGKIQDWAAQKSNQYQQNQLANTARTGEHPGVVAKYLTPDAAVRVVGDAAGLVRGATSPEALATTGAAVVAPEVVAPALAYQGVHNMIRGWGDLRNPDVLQNELNSAAQVAGSVAMTPESLRRPTAGYEALKAKVANRGIPTPDQTLSDFKMAIPPSKSARYEDADVLAARPYLEQEHANVPIEGVEGTRDAADSAIGKIETHIDGLINNHPNEIIQTSPLRAVQQALRDSTNIHDLQAGLESLEGFRLGFQRAGGVVDPPLTLRAADDIRARLNQENKAILKKNNYDVYTARATDPAFAAREAAAEALRDGIYDKLEQLGYGDVRALRLDEGSLIKVRNAAENNIYKNQQEVKASGKNTPLRKGAKAAIKAGGAGLGAAVASPLGVHGSVGGAVAGAAAAEPIADALTQAKPLTRDELMERSFKGAGRTPITATPAPSQNTGQLTRAAVPTVAASQAVPAGMIHVQDSAGAIHELPESALGAATARDPGLKVLRSN